MRKTKKIFLFSLFALLIVSSQPLYGEQLDVVKGNGVSVLFPEPLKNAAEEVADIYPGLIAELEKTLKWKLGYEPKVLLVKDRTIFRKMAGSALVVAYAVPQRKLIAIDYSRMNTSPFNLETTLKHELCHLLLHRHIPEGKLPKWLDEGVAQWISNGIAEIIMDRSRHILIRAALTGSYIPIDDLAKSFPQDRQALLLAYEESKSFVEYIVGRFGSDGLRKILENLKNGDGIGAAIEDGASISLYELEKRWHTHLSKRITWFTYLSNNLYWLLFFLAAMLTIVGFIRVLKRKKDYKEEDDREVISSINRGN